MSSIEGNARNVLTGESRPVKMSIKMAEKVSAGSMDKCTGPCRCTVEPDGTCPRGWPSRLIALHIL
jgi:hypothetical protein